MLLAALGAGALVARVPTVLVAGALVVSLLSPAAAVAAVLAVSVVSIVAARVRRTTPTPGEGDLLRQLAGRVSAGATIRSTIADPAMDAVPRAARRLAALGMPMPDVGDALTGVLSVNGQAFRAICAFSEHTGAAISSALVVLAERADEATEFARYRRVSLAQAKFSAVVVGIVPICASIGLIVLNGIPSPGGAVIVVPMVIGLMLQVLGTAIVFRVATRAT